MSRTRIADKIDKFNDYILGTDKSLQETDSPTTIQRFGWTNANKDDWHERCV